jgi:hypothetical protein
MSSSQSIEKATVFIGAGDIGPGRGGALAGLTGSAFLARAEDAAD